MHHRLRMYYETVNLVVSSRLRALKDKTSMPDFDGAFPETYSQGLMDQMYYCDICTGELRMGRRHQNSFRCNCYV